MAMDNAFQTDMPVDLMTNLLNKQITSQAKWDIEEYDVDGTEEQQTLVILGNDDVKSRVVMPKDESVSEAKEKIQSVLDGR